MSSVEMIDYEIKFIESSNIAIISGAIPNGVNLEDLTFIGKKVNDGYIINLQHKNNPDIVAGMIKDPEVVEDTNFTITLTNFKITIYYGYKIPGQPILSYPTPDGRFDLLSRKILSFNYMDHHPKPTDETLSELIKMINTISDVSSPAVFGRYLFTVLELITTKLKGYSVLIPQLEGNLLNILRNHLIPELQINFGLYLIDKHPMDPMLVSESVRLLQAFLDDPRCNEAIGCALSPLTPILYAKNAEGAAKMLIKTVGKLPGGSLEYARLLYNGIGVKKDRTLAKNIAKHLPAPYNEMELRRANSGPKSAIITTALTMGAIIGGVYIIQKYIEMRKNSN